VSDIYLILNETTFHGTDAITTEVVSPAHPNLQSALDGIQDIAEELEVVIDDDADSVTVEGPSGTGIATDEYYIIEMEMKSNG
jgi:hypothetical protein